MSNDKKQPYFTELVWESTEQNIPIPPRDAARDSQPKPVPKSDPPVPKAVQQLQLWDSDTQEPVTTTESQFVQRAKELEAHKEPPALFMPFKSYWPTYGHMTGAQSRWYFYWRDEVRQGRYPKTDLSYIFLHVYELINGVGWRDPAEGCRQLFGLWEAYREDYKRLDQYLAGWIADFSFVHHLDIPLSQVVSRTRGLAGDLAEIELMRCLTSARDELTFPVLTVMSDYDISKSKFYLGGGKEASERYIPQVIALIDAYVVRIYGKTLIEMFPPGAPVLRERYLFRSAVYDISLYGYSVLVPVVRVSKSPPLRSLVTRLFRLTENKLREQMGFKGRLKDVKVDADMEELVSRFLKREFTKERQQTKGPAVVIDPEKLERLQTDSDIVRSLLTVEALEETERERAEMLPVTDGQVTGDQSPGPDEEEEPVREKVQPQLEEADPLPVTAGRTEPGDYESERGIAEEWQPFITALSPLQHEALAILAGKADSVALQKLAMSHGTMPELLLDEINDLAMELLGDLLIDGDEITEEFQPLLEIFNEVNK